MELNSIIKLLPDSVANQIAAGEVVQRPSSVVKELLENSIDANSTEIKLIVKNAGKTLIQVIDNGIGMNEVDARMCFERHATSKLRLSEDLFKIKTMGFRGEALASIAAVSQVELITVTNNEASGTYINIEGSSIKEQNYTYSPKGTKISVKNIFFNVPARRNFLKSNPVELKHIIEEFQKIAISRPDIAFSFYNDDTNMYQLPATKLSHRIVNIFGQTYKEQLLYCEEKGETVKIKGYIGKPENAKKTRGEQFLFVNNRFIKSQYLNHAIKSAFQGLIPPENFPFYVFFIEIDPTLIDINIHPTKTEIKFQEEKLVYALIQSVTKKALAEHHIIPSLDFDRNINSNIFDLPPANFIKDNNNNSHIKLNNSFYKDILGNSIKDNIINTNDINKINDVPTIFKESYVNNIDDENDHAVHSSTIKIQINNKYIVSSLKSSILIINQKHATERVIYERVINSLSSQQAIDSQQILFPYELQLTHGDYLILSEHKLELNRLGLAISFEDKNKISIKGHPTYIEDNECVEIIESILEKLKQSNLGELSMDDHYHIIAETVAKKASLKTNKHLSSLEMDAMVENLFLCNNPNYNTNGEKTFVLLYSHNIDQLFNI